MPRIDLFIEKIPLSKECFLMLESDNPPYIVTKDGKNNLTNQILGMVFIVELLYEILPRDLRIPFSKPKGEFKFNYNLSPEKSYKVSILKSNTRIRVTITPQIIVKVEEKPTLKLVHEGRKVSNINELLIEMVEARASDLHLSSGFPPIVRIDGEMKNLKDYAVINNEDMEKLLFPILPHRNNEEFQKTSDTDFSYEIENKARFRVNLFRDRNGPGAVFRLIPYQISSIEALGLPGVVKSLCMLDKGLILVSGPTGSGKSTTLAAMINYINQERHDHIITIEDPIEFVYENKNCFINQREVGTHTISFKRALRAALREDPDIVLIGEMRDLETIAIALETAETGHLVLATLHTTTAASTIDRIIDQFPPEQQSQIRVMLSETLKGVISQTLLRKKSGGRIAAFEVLIVNSATANLIREGKTFQIPSVIQTNRQLGMITLNDYLANLIKDNIVTVREAYKKSVDKTTFISLLRSAGISLEGVA